MLLRTDGLILGISFFAFIIDGGKTVRGEIPIMLLRELGCVEVF